MTSTQVDTLAEEAAKSYIRLGYKVHPALREPLFIRARRIFSQAVQDLDGERRRLQRGPVKPHFVTTMSDLSATAARVIRRLPVAQRSCWTMRYIEGLNMLQVADATGFSVEECWNHHNLAFEALNRALRGSPEPLCLRSWAPRKPAC